VPRWEAHLRDAELTVRSHVVVLSLVEERAMALFSQPPRKDEPASKIEPRPDPPRDAGTAPAPAAARPERSPAPAAPVRPGESVLAAGLTIEGKIEGNGNVRVAGNFKGNVTVKGELTIEPGAKVEGEVSADAVLVGGEVRGQIAASSRVELRESGVLVGDLRAGSLTVAAGSKMRGNVEFGWKAGEIDGAPSKETGHSPIR
jgi:cytoskeletal protein CcmA (bactofilin family)